LRRSSREVGDHHTECCFRLADARPRALPLPGAEVDAPDDSGPAGIYLVGPLHFLSEEAPRPVWREQAAFHCRLLRDIFGRVFRPATLDFRWLLTNSGLAERVARAAYDEHDFTALPILADALEEASCDNPDILSHLRGPGPHVRGCWAVDLILGKQ